MLRFRIGLLLLVPSLILARGNRRFAQNQPGEHSLTTYQSAPTITDGTGGSVSSVTSPVWKGTNSAKLTYGDVNVGFRTTITATNVCADSAIRVTFRFPNKTNLLRLARFDVALRNDGSNYILNEFSFFVDTNLVRFNTWQSWTVHRRDFTQVGAFDCAQMDEIKITMRADAGTVDTVYLGEVSTFRLPAKGTLILTSDDGRADFYEYGYAAMIAHKFCHFAYINAGILGTSGRFTKAELDSYYNRSGGLMRIGSHLWKHDSTTVIGADSAVKLQQLNTDFILQNGYRGSPRLLAYPYGNSNTVIDSAMVASGLVDFQRGVREIVAGTLTPFWNQYAMPTIGTFGNTMTVAQGVAHVDSLVARKTTGFFYGHRLTDGGVEDGQTWDVSKFTALLDSIQIRVDNGGLDVVCLDDWLASQGGGGGGPRRNMGIGP